jgi:hypothetical protein
MTQDEFIQILISCIDDEDFSLALGKALSSVMEESAETEQYECASKCRDLINYLKERRNAKEHQDRPCE